MKNKALSLLMVILIIFTVLPLVSYAGAGSESVVFKNADNGVAINEIASTKNINAEVSFVPTRTGKANVITAGYSSSGALSGDALFETIDVTSGKKEVHTTKLFNATNSETVKVFVWMQDTMSPVITRNGFLSKIFSGGKGFSQKLNALHQTTQDNPRVVVGGKSLLVSELFETADETEINSKYFNVLWESVGENTASCAVTTNVADWSGGTVTFSGEGILKLTALDYDFCIPTVMYVNVVSPVDRYETVFENTDEYLYRVGNLNAVKLGSLFRAAEAELPISNTVVMVNTVYGIAKGAFTKNAGNWADGTIKFSGTGVVEVVISDDNSLPYSLLLEIVDGENVTTIKNAISNNIVLLNDTSGTFTVRNGKTLYGNGFTVTLPTTYQQKGNGFAGYVTLGTNYGESGSLDNVRIVGPVYPEMKIQASDAIFTDSQHSDGIWVQYFNNSVIIMGGDSTISNSYISGSRAALCVQGGNVVIENTTLSGGTYANLNICSGNSVTLRNLTTVQTDVLDSYSKGVYAHGLGIVVDSNAVDVNIEGELRQNNWVCEEQWENIVPSALKSKFPKFFTETKFEEYWHYLNKDENTPYVNLAIIFACNWNKDKINDYRELVDYTTCDTNILLINGGIYSKTNTYGVDIIDSDIQEPVWTPSGFNPVAPVFSFDNSINADADDVNDEFDTYCVYKDGNLNIGIKSEAKTIALSGVKVKKNGVEMPYTVYFNGVEVSGTSVTVSADNGFSQSLEFKSKIEGLGFDASGNPIEGEKEYTWTVPIAVATLSYPAPVWNMGGVYEFDTSNCYFVYYSKTDGYGEAVPIYEGIKVNYYNEEGTLIEKDFSGTKVLPAVNDKDGNEFVYTLNDGSKLTMKSISGWKQMGDYQFAVYEDKVYVYPKVLDNNNYIRPDKTRTDFNIKISYTFTNPNGQTTETVTMNWYNPVDSNNAITDVQWKTFDSVNGKKPTTCVTGDTLVMLSNGSQKRLDAVTYEDEIVVWDFYNGEYTAVPASYIQNHGYGNNTVIKLNFDDGTIIKVVNEHGFFDVDLNEFVFIDADNAEEYIGHSFMKQDGNAYKTVKLADYDISEEYIESYSILTYKYYNCLLEGMFSVTPSEIEGNLFMPFEVGEKLTFDKDKMEADIEKYGLYSYKEFEDKLTLVEFEALNMPYIKVAVGKGILTYDEVIFLLDLHFSK